jgi:hypothetical protein
MFGSSTDEIFKTTASIYKSGPPKEYRYKENTAKSECSEGHADCEEKWKHVEGMQRNSTINSLSNETVHTRNG